MIVKVDEDYEEFAKIVDNDEVEENNGGNAEDNGFLIIFDCRWW